VEEEDLILMTQEQARIQKPILQSLEAINSKLSKLYKRTNRSMNVIIDLSEAHTEEPLGLGGNKVTYLWLTVEKADSPFTYSLRQVNGQKSSNFIGVESAALNQHEFIEVYVTNTAQSGIAVIQVGWNEDGL